MLNSAFWGQSFVAELTRISAHGERKLKLRRASLIKETEKQAQEQARSPVSNVDGITSPPSPSTAADRSIMSGNDLNESGAREPKIDTPTAETREETNGNTIGVANGIADGAANGNRNTNGAA